MPDKTFRWKHFNEWRSDIEELFPNVSREKIIAEIRKNKTDFEYADYNPFEQIYSSFADYRELVGNFITRFPRMFSHVRMFHSCRPIDVSSYYSKGICVLDAERANRQFQNTFLNNQAFPQITEIDINQAINMCIEGLKVRNHKVFFGIDDIFMLMCCRQYLERGSEYVISLTTNLGIHMGLGDDFTQALRNELKKQGKPTVFKVNMPVQEFRKGNLGSLAYKIFPSWAFALANDRTETPFLDLSIELETDLPSEFIAGHFHP